MVLVDDTALARTPLTAAVPQWSPPPRALKHVVRDVLAGALWYSRSKRVRPAAGTLTIVTLHRFLPPSLRRHYPWPQLAVTPAAFRRMLAHFSAWFRVLPLSEALDAWQSEANERPLLAITVDDGQWDNFRWARPLLKHAGLRATFYVPTAAVDEQKPLWPDRLGFGLAVARTKGLNLAPLRRELSASSLPDADTLVGLIKQLPEAAHHRVMDIIDGWLEDSLFPEWGRLMTWDEIRELAAEGHEIGGHSQTHPILPLCSDERLHRETQGCMDRLHAELSPAGHKIRSFAYPNGDTDDRVCQMVRAAGFENAVTCSEGRADPAGDRLRLARIDLQEELLQGLMGEVSSPSLAYRLRNR